MNGNKRIEKMNCEKCLHYDSCLKHFREAKKNGQYELTDEEEYFAHADDCDMFISGYSIVSNAVDEFASGLKDFLQDAPVVYQAWFGRKIDSFADRFKKKYTKEGK